ncbi:MAG TPA: right-handed parallel beta-helix repeat-containing protein [Bacteroidales bacterium]|nr:right-handed parallel beta-helix repeat-containing protein [Bacteroidales bacterium]
MKRLFILFTGFFILSMQQVWATDVFGTISADSTWDVSGSPYIVTSSLTIAHGATLTIDPGVAVRFDDGQSLYINGGLNATNVIFTSNNPSPASGIWGNFQVGNGNPADSGSVVLNACQLLYGSQFNVTNGTATLNGTDISNFINHTVWVDNWGHFNMTGGNINTNNSAASSWGCAVYGIVWSHTTLSGVTIQHYNTGVHLHPGATVSISDMNITNCGWPISFSDGGSRLIVSGTNSFTGNNNNVVLINSGWELSDTLNLPVINIPYYFPGGLQVNPGGCMIVESNNILKFQDNTILNINGTLIAEAGAGESIYFTSFRDDNWGGDSNNDGSASAPGTGNWYGIRFGDLSYDANCLMRRCQVRYAGYDYNGGITTESASPTIDQCDLSNNYYGICMRYTSNPVFTNNTIGSSQMTPIAMSFEADPVMSDNTLSFSDNAYDAIGLLGGTLSANAVLKIRSVTSIPNITYFLLGHIHVPSGLSLTINKGIVIKSYQDWDAHRITVDGMLTANASADSMIVFTSARDDNYGNPADCNKDGTMTSPVTGDWSGIIFLPGSTGTMNYCRIKYAKLPDYGFSSCSVTEYVNGCAIGMVDASPSVSNCIFENLFQAVSCYRASSPALTNLDMINISYTPVNISGAANPAMSGITFTNVGMRAIGLLGGNVCQNGTLRKRDLAGYTNITYVLLWDMTINSGTYVNVEQGIVIKSAQYAGCGGDIGYSIIVDGGFKTDGTSGQGVVFTSIKDDNKGNPADCNGDGNATTPAPGDWGCIKFRSTSDDAYCKLNYTELLYSGRMPCNVSNGGAAFENAGGQMNSCLISNSYRYGVYCDGNATPLIDNVVIQNCTLDPIAMSLTANPSFSNITFVSNFSKAIKIIEGTLSSNATLAPRNVAGITNIAYVVSALTVSSNAKLTIQPDVVIKFRTDDWCGWYQIPAKMNIYGNLIATGNASHKIYFTSFADDSKGGDSNNDGNTSVPSMGDWGYTTNCDDQPGGLRFYNNSQVADTVNSLKYCEISYPSIGVRVENAHMTLDNCVIQQSSFGLSIRGSSNPEIKNTQFYNLAYAPVELSMFSNPSFTNCTALNVGLMALAVIPETYSQTDTIPVRDFGGYSNIGYFMEGTCTINSGTTITIPAGIVFKRGAIGNFDNYAMGFEVNGRLNIMGATGNPVVFTNLADDNFGNPPDMNQNGSATQPNDGYSWGQGWFGTWLTFNDVSDDLSTVDYAVLKYGEKGIITQSASPVINHSLFENLYYGIDMNGVSAPGIDNCTFNNLRFYPVQISLVSYPVTSSNNTISGTTYKVLKVRDETLTQDVTLPKRNFGGITNIPYYFEHYTVGTGATLTISPGIVCKFRTMPYTETNNGITVYKGFSATGGASPDSNIVFTDIRDDYYGGDANSDGNSSWSTPGSWSGLVFEDQSLDPLCNLQNCIIRFAENGIMTNSASPTVTRCNINRNNYGVYAIAASSPVFNDCDFDDNYYFAINNVDKSFTIMAENCWWGSNLGPIQTNTPGNGTSVQELVTDEVDYTPWKTTGAVNPLMGDVSLNGQVQAYDASLILQKVVGSITLNNLQLQVADVSGTAGVTAYDASLILQYVVGLINSFPAEQNKALLSMPASAQLSVGNATTVNGQDVTIPLSVTNVSGMSSAQIRLHYDPLFLKVSQVENMITGMNMMYGVDSVNGIVTIAMAGAYTLNSDAVLANITFHANLPAGSSVTTSLIINEFLANEDDMTAGAINGSVTINDNMTTGVTENEETRNGTMSPVYPNPATTQAVFSYVLNGPDQMVTIEIFDMLGQKNLTIVNHVQHAGKYSVSLAESIEELRSGSYLIRLTVDGYQQTQLFQIIK